MDVLRALEKAALNIRPREVDEISRQETWEIGRNADLLRFASDPGPTLPVMDVETFVRISRDACRVDSMMSTLRTLLDTGSGLQEVFNECLKPVITKLSRGITSTPDELLVLIFNLVGRRDGTKQAVRLSHVSRKFRSIALGEKRLWTTLHSRASKDELEALISRSGQVVDLHVVIHIIAEVTFNLQAFMDICFPTAPRWKSLAVIEVSQFEYGDQRAASVLKTMNRCYDLHLPRLHELQIERYPAFNGDTSISEILFKPTWYSPNLRVLRCNDYTGMPSPSTSFSSLSLFSYVLYADYTDYAIQLRHMFSFLASTPAVTDLELQMDNIGYIENVDQLELAEFICPSVISFGFHLPLYIIGTLSNNFIGMFLRTFRTPNLEQMSVSIDFRAEEFMAHDLEEDRSTELLAELVHALLPDPIAHQRLTSLAFKLSCKMPGACPNNIMTERYSSLRTLPRTFTIPLDKIPNVASLTLTTDTRTLFIRGEPSDPCGLRVLCFRGCEKMDSGLLQEAIQSLKDVGAWGTLERFVVEDCKALEYGVALDLVGAGKLQFLES